MPGPASRSPVFVGSVKRVSYKFGCTNLKCLNGAGSRFAVPGELQRITLQIILSFQLARVHGRCHQLIFDQRILNFCKKKKKKKKKKSFQVRGNSLIHGQDGRTPVTLQIIISFQLARVHGRCHRSILTFCKKKKNRFK